jgi:hypothetical protein
VRLDAAADDGDPLGDQDRALAVAQDLAVALHGGEPAGERFERTASDPDQLREALLVHRNRLGFERLQDELTARQRRRVPLGLARGERVDSPARRVMSRAAGLAAWRARARATGLH